MAAKKPENMSFEESLSELDGLVNQLEQGDLALEDALKNFERGVALARISQVKLNAAEQRIQVLLQDNDDTKLTDFEPDQHFTPQE